MSNYFSIIMPLYNKEEHVKRTISSVLSQTYKLFELIIVNDGSTDNSHDIICSINDERINIINQDNNGVSSARNTGINKSKYEFVAFIDADDEWHPDFLYTMIKLINKYPNAYWWGSNYTELLTGVEKPFVNRNPPSEIINYFQFRLENNRNPVCMGSFVIRKELITQIGFFPVGVAYGEDIDFCFRIARNHTIVWTPNILSYYYQDTDNRASYNENAIITAIELPFCKQNKQLLLSSFERTDNLFWTKEYIIYYYLRGITKLHLLKKHSTKFITDAWKILWECRKTSFNKLRFFGTLLYLIAYSLWLPKFCFKKIAVIKNQINSQ